MTFVQRQISVTITLGSGNFQGGGNSKTIGAQDGSDGINAPRISAHIDAPGGVTGSRMTLAIYGMPLADMNQLSTVGKQLDYRFNNAVSVMAGDANSGMQLIFTGLISFAFVDAAGMPDVCLRVMASPGSLANAQSAGSKSNPGGTMDVASTMAELAKQGNFDFEPNGIAIQIQRQYLWGSVGAQIAQLAQAAGVEYIIDRGKLAIWMPGTARGGAPTVNLAPPELVGYPTFNQAAVLVRSIFNSNFQNGGMLALQSSLTPACGNWVIVSVSHDIEANTPKGKWWSNVRASGIVAATP